MPTRRPALVVYVLILVNVLASTIVNRSISKSQGAR